MRASHVFSKDCRCAACEENRIGEDAIARPLTLVDMAIGAVCAAFTTVWVWAVVALMCAIIRR